VAAVTVDQLVLHLDAALKRFEWERVDELCAELVRAIRRDPTEAPGATRALRLLRRKRRFDNIVRLAEALFQAGHDGPGSEAIRRQYAQALIDLGILVAAERVLEQAIRTSGGTPEDAELRGLMGRVHKQRYLALPSTAADRRRDTLQHAIRWYLDAYRADPRRNTWHGINVVALVERGRRDGVPAAADRPASEIAAELVRTLAAGPRPPSELVPAWEAATLLEAYLALGQTDALIACARDYTAHPDVDAFEAASTLRQLQEIWNLTDEAPPGSSVLPLLRAKLLIAAGGGLTFTSGAVSSERARAERLELVHGVDRFQTLKWYRQGLDCCSAIARIETESGRGLGTGWLVRAGECFPHFEGRADEPLLVTNAHVVSPASQPFHGALSPTEAVANFQVAGEVIALGDIMWSSPVDALDCTVVRLTRTPAVAPLELAPAAVRWAEPPPRLYIIGHPGGRDVEFSLQDNCLLGCNDRLLHYRTPTEGGSSGSPVFNAAWKVVGLHHAGADRLTRLDGQPGTYQANEGIALTAIRAALSGAPASAG
jgi:hypothetical protein